MSLPRLTAVVLSYDGRHLLEAALPSFAAQTYDDYRVLVVDNGSRDDTREWLAEHHPDVDVHVIEENAGVTAGLNAGWRAAGTELVALFNNDLELDRDCLAELVRALDEHPEAGFAGAKLVDYHDRTRLDGAGDLFRWQGTGWRRGHGEPDDGRYDRPGAIFSACGGAALYRLEALEAVGEFDESFFAFCEDTDWALRAQLAGFQCRYVPTAIAYHMGSATIGKGLSDFTRYHLWRNSIWMVAKDYPAAALVRHAPQLVKVQLANFVVAARDRKLGIWWRSLRDAIAGLGPVLRRRRAVQATRRVGVRELEAAASADP